jgi:hypothetical protein
MCNQPAKCPVRDESFKVKDSWCDRALPSNGYRIRGIIMSPKINPKKLEEGTAPIRIPLPRIWHISSSGIEADSPKLRTQHLNV